jgi:hypothetical protein
MRRALVILILSASPVLAVPPQPLNETTDTRQMAKEVNRIVETLSIPDNLIKYKVGTFSSSSSTGNQRITGVGFRPRLLVLGMGSGAGDAIVAALGWGTSSTERVAVFGFRSDDTNTGGVTTDTARIIQWTDVAATVVGRADLVSLDSDGFTLNWTVAQSRTIAYIAFQ